MNEFNLTESSINLCKACVLNGGTSFVPVGADYPPKKAAAAGTGLAAETKLKLIQKMVQDACEYGTDEINYFKAVIDMIDTVLEFETEEGEE